MVGMEAESDFGVIVLSISFKLLTMVLLPAACMDATIGDLNTYTKWKWEE